MGDLDEEHRFLGSIIDFPIPPSENEIYRNVVAVGRVKTSKALAYESEVMAWRYTHLQHLRDLKQRVSKLKHLELTIDFRFLVHRVYTKTGEVKRMDVSNRLKILLDALAGLLEIDDSHFFKLHVIKSTVIVNEKVVVGFFSLPFTQY